ncbi:MarR family winged helix-turn-helix transcriptional regulator [Falsiroseomonas sp. E2-1-a20]|uniref:MarR family winged helix-turn-helix transcriptional regulator n=1 Tax=Falsiroseomonas sp. E2-1-a20 TaxID=3239300 RepID=UPI003F3B8342
MVADPDTRWGGSWTGAIRLNNVAGASIMDTMHVDLRQDPAFVSQLRDSIMHLSTLVQSLAPAAGPGGLSQRRVELANLAQPRPTDLKRLIQLRAQRRRDPTGSFLEWPAWDMLLDLAAVKAEGGHVSVSAICVSSGAPQSTALRKLAQLERAGLVRRYLHEKDRRRICLALTDAATELVNTRIIEDLRFYAGLAAAFGPCDAGRGAQGQQGSVPGYAGKQPCTIG